MKDRLLRNAANRTRPAVPAPAEPGPGTGDGSVQVDQAAARARQPPTARSNQATARPERVTLSRAIRDQLLDRIRRGEIRPGECLPGEHELAKMFGVGRSSVREGLQALVLIGLVEPRPGRGYVVNGLDVDGPRLTDLTPDVLQEAAAVELAEVRQWLEVTICELAARRATEADFRRMQRALNRLRRAAALGQPVYRASADFHVALAAAAHNRVLFTLMRSLRGFLNDGGRATDHLHGHSSRELERHEALYAALRSREPDRVRREMIDHLTDSLRDHRPPLSSPA